MRDLCASLVALLDARPGAAVTSTVGGVNAPDLGRFVDTHDATAVADEIRSGGIDPYELLDLTLARLHERDPVLNATVSVCADEARAGLATLDRDAPFAGVPFVVKDLGAAVAGLPHTRGSRLWADAIAAADSELVRRYRAAGFVIIATTNTPELGKNASTEPLIHGPARNPHRPTHSPGGSSGGTAAAVAAGIAPIGHGNDGGGSIRIPAGMCGLVGLKPSRGRTTGHPELSQLTYPLAVNHVLTRSVRDTARALDATAGPMPGDAYAIGQPTRTWAESVDRDPSPLRIAVSVNDRSGNRIHEEPAGAVLALAELLADLGHEVVEAAPAWPNDDLALVMRSIAGVITKLQVDDRLAELGRALRDDDLEPFTRMLYNRADEATGEQVIRAMRAIESAGRSIGEFFVDHDLLLTATLAEPTPPLGHLDTTDIAAMIGRAGRYSELTSPFNVSGQPAISLPTGAVQAGPEAGMPIGVQLVGAFGREDLLLAVSGQVERAQPWSIEPVGDW